MALTKTRTAITQLTATGQSTTVDMEGSYRHSAYVRHANGTGTITAGATIILQVRPKSSTTWYESRRFTGSTTASEVQTFDATLPDDAAEFRIDYTAPAGSTGHTLDAEVGQITAY